MRRNANGEATIYKCTTGNHAGEWIGQITIAKTPEGKLKRRSFYSKTKTEVKLKMQNALYEVKKGVDLHKQSTLTLANGFTLGSTSINV